MARWFFSLQFRLIAGFALVLALALGSVSAYIGFAAQQEVEKIQAQFDEARGNRVSQTLYQFYSANGGWSGIQTVIERAGFLSDREIVVVDDKGEVVADSRGQESTVADLSEKKSRFHPLVVDGRKVGSVFVSHGDRRPRIGASFRGPGPSVPPEALERFREPRLTRFVEAIKRSLVAAGVAAGAGGILLISLVSRRALSSVRALNSAARALGQGNLSQRVKAEGRDEIGELGRTFNSMADGLESAERQRRNMVADVAHELRTPLSNIQGYIEALRDGLLNPDDSTLDTVHQQVLYLSHLVEDLKVLAETEAPGFQLDWQLDSIADAIRKSVEAFRPKAEAAGVVLGEEVASDLPLMDFDTTRISQVLSNLLENAIRYTPSGGAVTVSAELEGTSKVRVTITDSGEGIQPEALPYVFDRFYRADPSRARATGGTGLGLTISRQLVQAHGGTIRAESTKGEGSRLVFDLPLRREPA